MSEVSALYVQRVGGSFLWLSACLRQSGRVDRAALSLTGHCLYRLGDYAQAAVTCVCSTCFVTTSLIACTFDSEAQAGGCRYKRLAQQWRHFGHYALHHAQALFKVRSLCSTEVPMTSCKRYASYHRVFSIELTIPQFTGR